MLDKLRKHECGSVGSRHVASVEPLGHRRNVASLSRFYRYHFGRCSSELAKRLFSSGRYSRYYDRGHDSSFNVPRCYKETYVNSSLSLTAKL